MTCNRARDEAVTIIQSRWPNNGSCVFVFAPAASPHVGVLISALAHTQHGGSQSLGQRKATDQNESQKTEGSKDQGAVIIPCYTLLGGIGLINPLRRDIVEHA
jgi:hypothetical protein